MESSASDTLGRDTVLALGAIAALPLAFYLRRWALIVMPKVREWMNPNSWLVNIAVYAIFLALILA